MGLCYEWSSTGVGAKPAAFFLSVKSVTSTLITNDVSKFADDNKTSKVIETDQNVSVLQEVLDRL